MLFAVLHLDQFKLMKIVLFPRTNEEDPPRVPSTIIPGSAWQRFIRALDCDDVAQGVVTSAVVWTLAIWFCALADFSVPETANRRGLRAQNHLVKEGMADGNEASVNQSRTNLTDSGIDDAPAPQPTESIAEPLSKPRVNGRRI